MSPACFCAEGGGHGGVGDDGDGERGRGHLDDREAAAVDGDRALLDQIARQARGTPTRRSGAGWRVDRRRRRGPGPGGRQGGPSRRRGRSRLTRSPAGRSPRLVRRRVSATGRAHHHPGPMRTTVRQHPLTAIESPMAAPLGDDRSREDQPSGLARALAHRVGDDAHFLDYPGEHHRSRYGMAGGPGQKVDAYVVAKVPARKRSGRARRPPSSRHRARRRLPGRRRLP